MEANERLNDQNGISFLTRHVLLAMKLKLGKAGSPYDSCQLLTVTNNRLGTWSLKA